MGFVRIKTLFFRLKQFFQERKQNEDNGFLSFRILYLCIFLPPVLYIFTVQGLEKYLDNTWSQDLSAELVSDMQQIVTGETRLQNEIQKNVQDFIAKKTWTKLGVIIQAGIRTTQGRQLYPVFNLDRGLAESQNASRDNRLDDLRRSLVARENLEILQEGLIIDLAVSIPHNTWISNIILIFYILSASLLLYRSYQVRAAKSQNAAEEQKQKLENTRIRLEQAQSSLREFSDKEESYIRELKKLRRDLEAADDLLKMTEEEALAELEDVEKKLSEVTVQREYQELEILQLSEHLEKLQTDRKTRDKKKQKQLNQYVRRFSVLYKNLKFHEKAIQGFFELTEDLQLKAEEIIHTLDKDIQKVRVKRKVFSRGNITAFETEFAYRGRLYWSRNAQGAIELLAVGTKNTQAKDLKYLEEISTRSI